MSDIDYALAWEFIDPDTGRPMQLRFRQNYAPPGGDSVYDGTGQLYAIVADGRRPDNGDQVAISRPGVSFDHVERILDGWQDWAMLDGDDYGHFRSINLGPIRQRINDAGLGLT
jgi:hypothetical protein